MDITQDVVDQAKNVSKQVYCRCECFLLHPAQSMLRVARGIGDDAD